MQAPRAAKSSAVARLIPLAAPVIIRDKVVSLARRLNPLLILPRARVNLG